MSDRPRQPIRRRPTPARVPAARPAAARAGSRKGTATTRRPPAAGKAGPPKAAVTRMRASAKGAVRNERISRSNGRVFDPEHEDIEPLDCWPWIYLVVGCLLVIPAFITTQAFFDSVLGAALDRSFWSHPRFWWFACGGLCWAVIFFSLPRPMFLYVLGHELTHYAFVRISGGQVRSLKVSGSGGYVETDRNNWLIALSPYFVPFYTVLALLVFGVLALFVDLRGDFVPFWSTQALPWSTVLLGAVGFTWAFHLTFTLWMISGDQSDLRHYGVFLSLMLIYLANLILVTALLILASGNFTWQEFGGAWWNAARELGGFVRWISGGA
jgi:hypothetical protein